MSDYDEMILLALSDNPRAWLSSRQIVERTMIGFGKPIERRQTIIVRNLNSLTKFGFLESKDVGIRRYWRLANQ